jgi:hypothetical protein
VLAAYGMMTMTVNKRPANWFIAVTVFAPLVRYELLAISAVSLILFLIYGYYRTAILALAGTILSLGAYSYFLVTLGLDPLPSSVLLKSSVAYEGTVWAVFRNLRDNLSLHENFPLLAALCVFTVSSLYSKDSARRILSRLAVLAVILHFLAGKFGWYYRYEAYIVGFCIATAFFVFSGTLGKELAGRRSRALASIAGCAFIIFYHYTYSLFTIPLASNNIYEQQYQMHRFATVFYRKPVAVNDIGYVSYKNPYYVLDLAGLSSGEKVRNFRIHENTDWMTDMARSKDVHFAMIYQHRFDKIPDDWIKIGDLHLGKIRITPADSIVAFYALDTVAYNSTLPLIAEFRQVLPQGVRFTYYGIR